MGFHSLCKGNILFVRIHYFNLESDGKLAEVGGGGQVGILK